MNPPPQQPTHQSIQEPDQQPTQQSPIQPPATGTRQETLPEAIAGFCIMLIVLNFGFTFLSQNFAIPSGSMEKTLLVGDHLMVDRITLAPPAHWMPLLHAREPQRGEVIVFYKPSADFDAEGRPDFPFLVKRLIGVPGDRIHLHNGVVILNGVAQTEPHDQMDPQDSYVPYEDEFPAVPTSQSDNPVTAEWAVELPTHIEAGDMVVPPGMYFMMGDHRHHSLDSRYWGFVPRANIIGRPLFNYWSFQTPDAQMYKTRASQQIAWMTHVVLHFVSDTRWRRSFHVIR